MKIRLYIISIIIVAAALFSFSGCTHGNKQKQIVEIELEAYENNKTEWPDKKLKDTFRNYWWTRFNEQFKKSYELEAPHVKSIVNKKRYQSYAMTLKSAKLQKIEIIEIKKKTNCLYVVNCYLRYIGKNKKVSKDGRSDLWVKLDNRWFHVLNNPLI